MFPLDWTEVFASEAPALELIVRGTVLYFAILAFFRVLPRRTGNEMTTTDLVFVLLIAEAAAHSMGDYESVVDGVIVITTFMLWNYLLNFLSFHFNFFEKLTAAPPA